MSSPTDPQQCAQVGCEETFMPHHWGNIRAQNDGWFLQKNGDAWCPDHIPEWVAEWRQRTQKNIHEVR